MDDFEYVQVVENPTEGTRWKALDRDDMPIQQNLTEEGLKDFMRALGWELVDRSPGQPVVYMFRRPKPLPPGGRVATSGPMGPQSY